jgi:hypothetical protein
MQCKWVEDRVVEDSKLIYLLQVLHINIHTTSGKPLKWMPLWLRHGTKI